jgi:hypothetical protein
MIGDDSGKLTASPTGNAPTADQRLARKISGLFGTSARLRKKPCTKILLAFTLIDLHILALLYES